MLKAKNFDEPIIHHGLYCSVEMRLGRHTYRVVKDPDGTIVKHFHPKHVQEAELLVVMLNEAYDFGHRDGRVEGRGQYEELLAKYQDIAR